MDLNQRKLNKSEWDSIEVPVSESEKNILQLIVNGYNNVNITVNNCNSIFTFLKIEYTEKMEDYLYNKYFRETILDLVKKFKASYLDIKISSDVQIKSADKIRLERNDEKLLKQNEIYEFILISHLEKILKSKHDNVELNEKTLLEHSNKNIDKITKLIEQNDKIFTFHYFTLYKLIRNSVHRINRNILTIINLVLARFQEDINISLIIENAVDYIEKNESLLKYGDMVLYEHQKEIFTLSKAAYPKLILYMAPTGTGKTLTPLALSQKFKIIFVCAARHVGLALAKSAISINKKVAFAFGCSSADDIRLHYFAAKVFTKNKRTGGIGKVDNSVGDDVEIMICDIKSYLPAMYYMMAFNSVNNLLFYWDEPTITLDYPSHEFHEIIKKNWSDNLVPNIVLSSATLPKLHELTETVADFKNKFDGAQVHSIVSHDCKKSIPIINKDGLVVLPHHLNEDYSEVLKIAQHCENYLTLLRYFDLKEVVEFITFVNKNNFSNSKMRLTRYFETIDDISMTNIKIYYIKLLQNILSGTWGAVYNNFRITRKNRIPFNNTIDPKGNIIRKSASIGPGINTSSTTNLNSQMGGKTLTRLTSEQIIPSQPIYEPSQNVSNPGIYVTTKDAFTLTDGPTIFLSNDVEKIAKFCIQQANIPAKVMSDLMEKIEFNNVLNERLNRLETDLDVLNEKNEQTIQNDTNSSVKGRTKSTKDCKKINRETPDEKSGKSEVSKLTNEINAVRAMIKIATLNDTFVPNKYHHLQKWAGELDTTGAFTSNIEEEVVNKIMLLHGIEDSWKVLLMMGIGVFTNHNNITYTEIMKKLADEQKLYMIIASSDYIYGTNYQFCHGYLSKDLDLTQEKIIQAMGRIGRSNIQQNYTLRFRDDSQIMKLFTSETDKPEIINMNLLFNSNKVVWNGEIYVQIPETGNEEGEKDCDDEISAEEGY
jgi:hypothetical protein